MKRDDQHHLNALVDLDVYDDYKFVAEQEDKSVNKLTNTVIKSFVRNWKKKNPEIKLPSENFES